MQTTQEHGVHGPHLFAGTTISTSFAACCWIKKFSRFKNIYQYSLGPRSGSVFWNRINSKSSTQEACCKRCLDPESITIGSIATLLLLSLEKRSTAPKPYGSLFIALLAIFQRLQYMFKARCILTFRLLAYLDRSL